MYLNQYLNKFFFRQCDETFPDGVACDENAEDVTQADPDNCWKYYKCHGGCVTHETCEEDYKYDDRFQWCTYPHDVDCGDRPCDDPHHCPAPTTIPTTTEDCSPPEQKINCTETGKMSKALYVLNNYLLRLMP